ncbi:MAG: DUF4345 family protein [Chloroflexota bacterium]
MNTKMIARVLAGIVALACLVIGIRYMFAPAGVLEGAGFDPAGVSILGLSTLRAVVGGAFLAFAIIVGVHTVRDGEDTMIRFMVLFWLLYTVGRIVGIVADGVVENTIRSAVPGVLLLLLSIGSVVFFSKSEAASA